MKRKAHRIRRTASGGYAVNPMSYVALVESKGKITPVMFSSEDLAKQYARFTPGVVGVQRLRRNVPWKANKNPYIEYKTPWSPYSHQGPWKCDECGKILKTDALAKDHKFKTGHSSFKSALKNPIWVPTIDRKTGKREARRVPSWNEAHTPGLTETEVYLANPKRIFNIESRGSILLGINVKRIETDLKSYDYKNSHMLLVGRADGSVIIRGFKGPIPSGKLKSIWYEDRAKAARENQALDRPWKHDVKSSTTMHLTSQGLLIVSREAPLWGIS
jgi:hypothetical protein